MSLIIEAERILIEEAAQVLRIAGKGPDELTFYRQVSERDKALAIQRAGLGRRLGSPVVPLRNSDQEQSQFSGEPQPEIENDSGGVSIVEPPDPTCSSGSRDP